MQIPHLVLHAANRLLALVVLGERLLLDPLDERLEQPRLEGGAHSADAFHAPRRGQRPFKVAGQGHQRVGEPAVEGAGRERRDAGRLHRAAEGLVVVAERLVVRSVARLVDLEQRDDQPGTVVRASDAARGEDVLGVHLRLPERQHQSQARDVEFQVVGRQPTAGGPNTSISSRRGMSRPTEIMLVAGAQSTRLPRRLNGRSSRRRASATLSVDAREVSSSTSDIVRTRKTASTSVRVVYVRSRNGRYVSPMRRRAP